MAYGLKVGDRRKPNQLSYLSANGDSAKLAMLVRTKESSSLFLIFTPSANLDYDANYTIMPSSAFTSQVL